MTMSRSEIDEPTHEAGTSFDPSRTAFERLRVTPDERLWLIELGKVLDGVRDHVIAHLGDAGDYVEDVIEQAEDPATSRALFLGALERQVAQWSPGRGDAWMIDVLRRFTPLSGFQRLVEMFRLPSFADDPSLERFSGVSLRLRALHAFERYFPAPPLPVKGDTDDAQPARLMPGQDGYMIYLSILHDHVRYPPYKDYAIRILTELREERMAFQLSYETSLSKGLEEEQAFRTNIEARGGRMIYQKKGPTIRSLDRPDAEPIKILVPDPLYSIYYKMYLINNNLIDFREFVARRLEADPTQFETMRKA